MDQQRFSSHAITNIVREVVNNIDIEKVGRIINLILNSFFSFNVFCFIFTKNKVEIYA